jgi:wyosine [tRNA(Phe)-imidazoG37] synthetase (radical SAM superfamily)
MIKEYTYGPFLSRRLGLSLGINILPRQVVCTYNCVYCEIGTKSKESLVPPEYRVNLPVKPRFRKELNSISKHFPHLDSMSFSGYFGEPTLNKYLPEFFTIAKEVRNNRKWNGKKPKLTIFTNSSTLYQKQIRDIVGKFELILAKLDVATDEDFIRTNRPHKKIHSINEIINSIEKLRKDMNKNNKLAIQCLIYHSNREKFNSNDNPKNIENLANAIKKIKPDYVQLYSIARTPAEYYVFAIDNTRKQEIVDRFKEIINDNSIQIDYY